MGAEGSKLGSPRHDGRSKYHDKLPNGKDVAEIMKEYRNAVPKQDLNPVPKSDTKGELLLKMRAEELRIERENQRKETKEGSKVTENGVNNNNSTTEKQQQEKKRTKSINKGGDLENRNSLKGERKERRKTKSPESKNNSHSKSRKERGKGDFDPEKPRDHKKARDDDRTRNQSKSERDEARKKIRKDGKDNHAHHKEKSVDDDGKTRERNKPVESKSKDGGRRRHTSRNADEEGAAVKREDSNIGGRKSRKERSRSRDRRGRSRSGSSRSPRGKSRERTGNDEEKGRKQRRRSQREVEGDVVASRDAKSPRDRNSKDIKDDMSPKKQQKSSKNKSKKIEKSQENTNKKSRKKNKSKLREKRAIHRSAPDLTDVNNSKVGAWLNSAPTWQPDASHPPWGYPMPLMNFGSLPRNGGRVPDVPRHIVDGMGNTVAQVYPVDPNVSVMMSPPYDTSAQLHSMHPYFTMPYAYMYSMQNVYAQQAENSGRRKQPRSKSTENIHQNSNENSKKPSVNELPVSPGNSQQSPFFSDIVETQNFISDAIKFQSNRTFSVDDVTLAKFNDQLEPTTSQSSESTSSQSCFNDVTIDLEEVGNFKVKSAAQKSRNDSATAPTNDVKIFQPKSNREVFIDSTPKKELKSVTSLSASQKSTLTSTTENSFKVPSLKSDKVDSVKPAHSKPSTIMRLCDSESIVATSFMAEGGKVFCIKRSKSESNPIEFKRKLSSIENQTKSAEPKPGPEGMWFGITASPRSAKIQPISAQRIESESSTNHIAEIKPQVQPTNREPRFKPRELPIDHVSPPMPKSIENLFKYPQHETKFIDNYKAASMLAKSTLNPATKNESNHQTSTPKSELVKPVLTTIPHKQKPFPVTSFNSVSQPNYKPKTPSASDSDSEVFEAKFSERSPSLAKKLVRIDSHDSFTMKRRFKHARKQSSGSGSPFGRRATIGSISQSDFIQIQSPSTPDLRHSVDSALNPFKAPPTPGIESYLHRAKSEEALKYNMSKSTEELLNEAPSARKETLQERAARILGLTSDDLNNAKQTKAVTVTNVTPSKAAMGNISHTSESPRNVKDLPKSTESESFAVSVTDSMIATLPNNVTVKVLYSDSSGDNVSTISNDDRSSISDQCLSNTTTEASLREYQLPTDFLNQSSSSGTSVCSPRLGQEGIVASYTNSIYDKLPPDSLRHSREYSDDTTESESVQSPLRKDVQPQDFTQPDHSRLLESPVPIASHSAPLTSGELDIIMQLYNSADEGPSTAYSNNHKPRSYASRNAAPNKNDLRKQQIAQAIGLDAENIGRGESPKHKLEKVEDFDIKVFPGARQFADEASKPTADSGNRGGANKEAEQSEEDGVYEVMQSLGLDPDQSWLVSL